MSRTKALLPLVLLVGCNEGSTNPPWGVPITGGTMLVTRDGLHAVVADPDRDRILSVDLVSGLTTSEVTLAAGDPGEWRAVAKADELGLWQATDGTLKALINVGPVNPKEFSEVTSTPDLLKPLSQATGGDARRIADSGSVDLPRVLPVHASSVFRGEGWLGVKMRDASVVRGIGVLPIFSGLLGLLLLIGSLAATWAREGR